MGRSGPARSARARASVERTARGFSTYTTANGLASNIVSSIAETGDGTVWFATPQGLSAFAGGRWRTYGVAEGLPSGAINCLLGAGADASLWVGTAAGLVRIVEGRVVANPLPPVLREQIFGLAEDNRGSLWVATSNRLLQVALDRLRRGQLGEGDIREFEKADGLRSVESTRRERSLIRGSRRTHLALDHARARGRRSGAPASAHAGDRRGPRDLGRWRTARPVWRGPASHSPQSRAHRVRARRRQPVVSAAGAAPLSARRERSRLERGDHRPRGDLHASRARPVYASA